MTSTLTTTLTTVYFGPSFVEPLFKNITEGVYDDPVLLGQVTTRPGTNNIVDLDRVTLVDTGKEYPSYPGSNTFVPRL